MARVVGLILDGEARAYRLDKLRDERALNDTLAGRPIVVFWQRGTATALEKAEISAGRDVGSPGVFDRTVDGRTLRFSALGNGAPGDILLPSPIARTSAKPTIRKPAQAG